MYVGYIESFSVRFFCTIEFLCMWVEQNIRNVNILLTCAHIRNNEETSTFIMDGGPLNRGWRPDLTACLVGFGPTRDRIGVVARQGRVLSMEDLRFVLIP
jgi:hypothetical protein